MAGSSSSELTGERLEGMVERVTFHDAESGFSVLQVRVPGHRELVPVVGHASQVVAGEFLSARGRWVIHRQHGRQFEAAALELTPPHTLAGMEKYLASGWVKGIGPVYAKRLVKAFGRDVFDVIEHHPERLQEVPGIGPRRASNITQGWRDQKVIRDIMVFLHSHGVSTAQAVRIFKTYGEDAIRVVEENPYRLARDIRGIGFKSADRIARQLGIDELAPIRIEAGVSYALWEAAGDGHVALPEDALIAKTAELLSVPAEAVKPAIEHEAEAGRVVLSSIRGVPCVLLASFAYQERMLAERLLCLAAGAPPWPPLNVESSIRWAESRLGLTLAPQQRRAVELALSSKVLVITGGPGVGKTTLLKTVVSILSAHQVSLALCAPTGRAAKRLAEATEMPAKTIHRLLGARPGGDFQYDAQHPLPADLVVVDECSMIDISLMYHLTEAISPRAALILVGDGDQIPSVGPGQVFRDILASHALPVVRLTEVFRQAAESAIVLNAHRINQGKMPQFPALAEAGPTDDFYFVAAETPEEAAEKVVRLVAERIPRRFGFHPLREVQVLCPMNRGSVGALHLNQRLQEALNPPGPEAVERFGWRFGLGDKVMQLVNDYDKEVFNGDVGWVSAIHADDQSLAVQFDDRTVIYDFVDLDALVPAYAMTIHKAQGSEYPAVVIPVMTQHYPMLRRNLLYTAVTRAKRLAILVGQLRAVAIAVRARGQDTRWSKLQEWLEELAQSRPSPSSRP
ncbi:MAG: ATP-dependent RecD-like DNA helicase [Firmicutes bacterium]|nr:ATP-dependent RecD-like DNA helicase [Bacillota bacterium]